ncbi:MAG: transporter [Calditrichaeota bacterium]|nr:MAG: transporter [Calditrichota bacterium]
MKRNHKFLLRWMVFVMAVLGMVNVGFSHEPVFGLGPHTIYQYGYAVGSEFEKGELGWGHHLEVIYGLTPDWAVTVVVPYQFANDQRPSGLGDLVFRTKYRFFRHDFHGASLQAALHAGVKWPTGDVEKRLGRGNRSGFVGASFGFESRRQYFFAGARVHINGSYRGLNQGEAFRFNLAYGIRPWKLQYHQPDPVFLLELNGNVLARDELNGQPLVNSGGQVLSLGPGLLFSYRNVMLKVGIGFPVLNNLNGDQESPQNEYVLALEMHMPPLK